MVTTKRCNGCDAWVPSSLPCSHCATIRTRLSDGLSGYKATNPVVNACMREIEAGTITIAEGVRLMVQTLVQQNAALLDRLTDAELRAPRSFVFNPPKDTDGLKRAREIEDAFYRSQAMATATVMPMPETRPADPLVVYVDAPATAAERFAQRQHVIDIHERTGREVIMVPLKDKASVAVMQRLAKLEEVAEALVYYEQAIIAGQFTHESPALKRLFSDAKAALERPGHQWRGISPIANCFKEFAAEWQAEPSPATSRVFREGDAVMAQNTITGRVEIGKVVEPGPTHCFVRLHGSSRIMRFPVENIAPDPVGVKGPMSEADQAKYIESLPVFDKPAAAEDTQTAWEKPISYRGLPITFTESLEGFQPPVIVHGVTAVGAGGPTDKSVAIAVHDPVRLKSTGQAMFVERIAEDGKLHCRWTKPSGLVERGAFAADEVEVMAT